MSLKSLKTSCKWNLIMKTVNFSKTFPCDVRVRCVPCGRSEIQKISTYAVPKQEIDPRISDSCVPSSDGIIHSISAHPVQPVEIRLFSVKTRRYSSFGLFVHALHLPLLTWTTGVSQICFQVYGELFKVVRSFQVVRYDSANRDRLWKYCPFSGHSFNIFRNSTWWTNK
jgi:hypothetical protein